MEITPGPNMAYLAIVSVSEGRSKGYAVTFGVALGLLAIGVIAALGVGSLISESKFLYECLRYSGIAYLFWLAWDTWKIEQNEPYKTDTFYNFSKYFKRGFITNILNPKAAIFYIAVVPNFIHPDESVIHQAITLTLMFVAIASFIHIVIVTMAGTLKPFLSEPKQRLITRRFLAILLVGVALWFGFSTHKDF